MAHTHLGKSLPDQGDLAGAAASHRTAIALNPKLAAAHTNLGNALRAQGDLAGEVAAYRQAITLDPKNAAGHYCLGNALRDQGDLAGAAAAFRRAVALRPGYAEAHCNLGQVLVRQGQFAAALPALRSGHELGSRRGTGWRYPSAQWLRNAERLAAVEPKLAAVLKGHARPADAQEGLALARLCQQPYQRRHAAAARLYAEAFAAEPGHAADLGAGHRYNAAYSAAQAGCGQGADAADLDDRERARLRWQALDWLRANLAAWAALAEKATPQARQQVRRALAHWRRDPDLGGLRDKAELARLPEAERRACRDLWADVGALLRRTRPQPGEP
jgi:serine/threonine-protein kinase